MREIKFRIWDKTDKAMLYPDCVPCINNEDDYRIYEEYTGLKDRNGKEIYEGDIVVANDNAGIVNGDKNQVVKFDGGMFIVEQSFVSLSYLCNFNVMVLGNIHQNPELLEETK